MSKNQVRVWDKHVELTYRPNKHQKKHILSAPTIEKRFTKSLLLLNHLKEDTLNNIFYLLGILFFSFSWYVTNFWLYELCIMVVIAFVEDIDNGIFVLELRKTWLYFLYFSLYFLNVALLFFLKSGGFIGYSHDLWESCSLSLRGFSHKEKSCLYYFKLIK